MDHNDGQCLLAILLPVAMTEQLDAGLDFYKAMFVLWKGDMAGKKKAGQGLAVASAQAAAGDEARRLELRLGLRNQHT